jgi:hypothetical protein
MRLSSDQIRAIQAQHPHCKYQFIRRAFLENSESDALAIIAEREQQNRANISRQSAAQEKRYQEITAAYNALRGSTIAATLDNVKLVGEYLRGQNYGSWERPKLSIGYQAIAHDCAGSIAVAFIFDEPIDGYKRIAVGAKPGYLNDYLHI